MCESIKEGLQERKAEKGEASSEEDSDDASAPKRERKGKSTAKKVAKEDQDAMNAAVASKFAKGEDEE